MDRLGLYWILIGWRCLCVCFSFLWVLGGDLWSWLYFCIIVCLNIFISMGRGCLDGGYTLMWNFDSYWCWCYPGRRVSYDRDFLNFSSNLSPFLLISNPSYNFSYTYYQYSSNKPNFYHKVHNTNPHTF